VPVVGSTSIGYAHFIISVNT